jgi:hypothetical protein
MLTLSFWLLYGVLGGLIVALAVQPPVPPKRIAKSMAVGVAGAALGGWVGQISSGNPFIGGFNAGSILLAAMSAVLLAIAFNFAAGKTKI